MWKTSLACQKSLTAPSCSRPAASAQRMISTMSPCMLSVASAIRRARPAQRGCHRQIPAGHIDLGRVRDRDAGATRAGDVVLGHDQAMGCDQLLVQKAGVVDSSVGVMPSRWRTCSTSSVALREVRHHAHAHATALVIHVAQEVARAGVDRMRREHHAGAAVERAVASGRTDRRA